MGARIVPARSPGHARDGNLARRRDQIVAAILLPSRFIVSGRARTLLAVADRGDACRVQREVLEIVLGRLGTSLAERQVVLARAALVAVPLDADVPIRPLPRLIEEGLEGGPRRRSELGGVVVEVDADGRNVGLGPWRDGFRRWRWRRRRSRLGDHLCRRWSRRWLRVRASSEERKDGEE